ncbi:hypothetical protein [uncultured Paraglaciecola sp.]|uniref:DUF4760 domain-containing protein n=1 Tax=uncultured Paraglaciecola sp. TaxID=1765024 RepID=UPI0025F5828C|nr:hypothetical protein [uncultured Paraglaciecola sp.]
MTEQEVKLQLAEIIGTWVAAIAVVVGGIFGMFQFLEHKSALRVDRTMAFVERYHANNLLVEARLKVTDVISRRVEDINEVLKDPNVQPDKLASLYNAQVVQIVKEESLSSALEQLFTFYEQILMCRKMELCEAEVAENFFDTDGQAYLLTFYPYICHIRSEWHNPKQYEKIVTYYLGESTEICN